MALVPAQGGGYAQLPEISSSIGAVNSSFSIISWYKKSNPDAGVFIHAGGSSSIICPRIESTPENKIKYYHRNGNTNNEPASELSFDLNEWNSVAYVVDGNSGSIKVT